MPNRSLDLNLFVLFDAIYHERNLTRAAERLGITQPGISNGLGRLRVRFDDPLFVRTGRVMAPTPLAENMIGPVQQALRHLDGCLAGAQAFDPARAEKTFTLSLSVPDSVVILPKLTAELATLAPGVRIRCRRVPRGQIVRDLTDGRLDLATEVNQLAGPPLVRAPLMQIRHVCAVRRDHPGAASDLTLDQYLSLRHIVVSHRSTGASHVEAALARCGRRQQSMLRLQTYQEAFAVLNSTDMAMAVPESMIAGMDFCIRPLPFPVEPLAMSLYWHSRADADPANRWLRRILLDVVA